MSTPKSDENPGDFWDKKLKQGKWMWAINPTLLFLLKYF
jgi:hypothetical protein